MRKITTVMLALLMATTSYMITDSNNFGDNLYPQNALHAATVPNWNYNGQLPLDVKLDLAKAIKPDTVVIHDTVTVNNTKYVRIQYSYLLQTCLRSNVYLLKTKVREIVRSNPLTN